MKRSKVLLTPWQKRMLYFSTALLWLSGALWLYYKYFGQMQGDYGLQAHPAQPLLLEIHGAAAMAFLMIFGILLNQHVPEGWKQGQKRPSGVSLITFCGILILTGWGLYYLGNEHLRHWTSVFHSVFGLLLPGLIFLHVWMTNRSKM